MRSYVTLSGSFFTALALVHLSRLVWQWPMQVGGTIVPVWLSVIALLITGSLAIWAFRIRARATGQNSGDRR